MTIEKSIASRNVTAINDKGSRIDIESTEKICGTERNLSVDRLKNLLNVGDGEIEKNKSKINIETRRSTTLKQRVILVQGPC